MYLSGLILHLRVRRVFSSLFAFSASFCCGWALQEIGSGSGASVTFCVHRNSARSLPLKRPRRTERRGTPRNEMGCGRCVGKFAVQFHVHRVTEVQPCRLIDRPSAEIHAYRKENVTPLVCAVSELRRMRGHTNLFSKNPAEAFTHS